MITAYPQTVTVQDAVVDTLTGEDEPGDTITGSYYIPIIFCDDTLLADDYDFNDSGNWETKTLNWKNLYPISDLDKI